MLISVDELKWIVNEIVEEIEDFTGEEVEFIELEQLVEEIKEYHKVYLYIQLLEEINEEIKEKEAVVEELTSKFKNEVEKLNVLEEAADILHDDMIDDEIYYNFVDDVVVPQSMESEDVRIDISRIKEDIKRLKRNKAELNRKIVC